MFIPALHGLHGEDGTIQGLFELADIPYASAGVLGSSLGMDKIAMKAAFKGADIPVIDGVFFTRDQWDADSEKQLDRVEAEISYPVIVKPANLGSSIGIKIAKDRAELSEAISVAASFDRRIIAEHAIMDNIEVNCSCLGYGGDVRASVCEQPVSWDKFLTFDEKYMGGGKTGSSGMASLSRIIPADIPDALADEIRRLSIEIFRLLDCKGVVRIDFIYDRADDKLYANEINTIPGSFAFYLWEPLGLSFPKLIDELVECAERANRDKNRSSYVFESQILNKAGKGAKGAKGGKSAKG